MAENEQLKEQVAALKGEMLLMLQQQQSLLITAQPVRESGAPVSSIAWPTADADQSAVVRAEAVARAADLKALQVSAEQLKVYVQRLAEKEQVSCHAVAVILWVGQTGSDQMCCQRSGGP